MKKVLILIVALSMISCGNNSKEIDLSLLENRSGTFYEKGMDKPFTGKVTAQYPDGQKMLESYWKDGKQEGKQIQYYKDGKPKIEGIFKDGKANGLIKVYDEFGKIIVQEEWRVGEKVKK